MSCHVSGDPGLCSRNQLQTGRNCYCGIRSWSWWTTASCHHVSVWEVFVQGGRGQPQYTRGLYNVLIYSQCFTYRQLSKISHKNGWIFHRFRSAVWLSYFHFHSPLFHPVQSPSAKVLFLYTLVHKGFLCLHNERHLIVAVSQVFCFCIVVSFINCSKSDPNSFYVGTHIRLRKCSGSLMAR